jgi:hypothetical protein
MGHDHERVDSQDDDAALLAIEKQFNVLIAELAAVQLATSETLGRPEPRIHNMDADSLGEKYAREARAEAILADLHPIEQAIMQTPACTIGGLGVKARHAAHVLSEYWEAPVEGINWDARVIRLLVEAICMFAGTPLNRGFAIRGGRFPTNEDKC